MARRGRFLISDLNSGEKTDITLQQSGIHNQQPAGNAQVVQQSQTGLGQSGGNSGVFPSQPALAQPIHNGFISNPMREPSDMPHSDSQERIHLEKIDAEFNHEEAKHSQDPQKEENIPITVLNGFQDVLSNKFSEMLSVHKDLVMEFLTRDQRREERIRSLLQEISEITRENVHLKLENQKLRDILSSRFRD